MKTTDSPMSLSGRMSSLWKVLCATILAISLLSIAAPASASGGVSVSPSTATTQPGSAAVYTITVNCSCGVILGATISPNVSNGPTASLGSYHLVNGGSASLRVDAGPSTPLMTYTITVTATDTQTHRTKSDTATLTVNDFSVTANPTSATVPAGQTANSTITASGLYGFTGDIHYTTTISPATGLACNLQPAVVSLSSTATTANSALSCSGAAGTYTVDISGSTGGGPPFRTATVTITIQ